MKPKMFLTGLLACLSMHASGAIYTFNNAALGAGTELNPEFGDTLYANSDNSYALGSIVAVGYFPAAYDLASNLTSQSSLITNYTILRSVTIGSTLPSFQDPAVDTYAGYTEYAPFDDASIVPPSALIGRTLYAFVGNTADLNSSTAFSLFEVGPIQDDTSAESEYLINPSSGTILIGEIGSSTVVPGPGVVSGQNNTFRTLKTVAIVPEPSSALLAMLGALSILRRKR
jgi:hypothetical protein